MILTEITEEAEKEFEEKMLLPDISNLAQNSPKLWQFEGYVAAKKEAKELLSSLIQKVAENYEKT